jgi:formate C-acetyltransferase
MSAVNPFGQSFQAGLYSVNHHAAMGELTSALPSGRRAGKALANALAPCQGADILGPTAVIRSALSVDHSKCGNGMVLDLKFTPQFFRSETHKEGIKALIKTYFKEGGMEIQFNVVNKETLLEAQNKPEEHRNLIVRVSGYSAYFVYLDKTLQDEIIARTEYGASVA